ncbi:type II toxin-antitoxin system VapC family toxin [Roseofilum casamattae]|uniref:PIN domain-containing protein n=1 Tax=Roseofilum casamattae BLCC-M143 TaxID=3022442 RepID=A0ABT7BZW1_9CYAN|nr:PIN domain-containing protein [Roseofilum casamattae]MDJ1184342.1 PIN domain-containing protein [Roseofilum casamattae BLCC-M143]
MTIVDTGFWVALFNEKDQYHQRAQEILAKYPDETLITTWCVLTETSHLLLQRSSSIYQGVQKQIKFINLFQKYPQQFRLFDLQETHFDRINFLMEKYRNLPMDLADASLVILAEELEDGRIFSIDYRDFNAYRWKNTKPFQNLFDRF